MTSTESRGVFALIEERLMAAQDDVRPSLVVRVGDRAVRLSPHGGRTALYGPRRDDALRQAVWRQAVAEARRESGGGDGTGRLLVVWLALPGLYRNLHRILRQCRVERADLEAEAVLALLAALDAADPDRPDPGRMIKDAVNRMWAYANRIRREVPVADIAAFADARNVTAPPEGQPRPADGWELHLTPPPRRDGLAATLRFAESRARRAGERPEAPAPCTGLPELVFRARRHEEADLIGTLVLRPVGAWR
ncbi:hypothetical protein AB0C13_20165 [Streptomyces sp. NPDC049099]|uniref:hypothetical protein n=1 Tax=Streptomyces sp. NPDC049099 TaxID=3155768 RepID=UPI003441ACD5